MAVPLVTQQTERMLYPAIALDTRRAASRISGWTRKTTSYFCALFRRSESAPAPPQDHLIYRLRHWPLIPSASKTADIYRTLSVMSQRPVNRRWILNNSSLDGRAVDRLLRRLVEQDAVHVVDARGFGPDTRPA